MIFFAFLAIRGGGGGAGYPFNYQNGPNLLPSYSLTYINLHIKHGSNLFRIFLSYRIHKKCLQMRWTQHNDD